MSCALLYDCTQLPCNGTSTTVRPPPNASSPLVTNDLSQHGATMFTQLSVSQGCDTVMPGQQEDPVLLLDLGKTCYFKL